MRAPIVLSLVVLPLLHVNAKADVAPPPPVVPAAEVEVPIAGAALLDWFIGFGSGQVIQGRWLERGWIFTAAETVGTGFIVYAVATSDCGLLNILCSPREPETKTKVAAGIGLSIVVVSRVAAIIEAIHGGNAHNRRIRERGVVPFVAPTDGGTTAGLMLQF